MKVGYKKNKNFADMQNLLEDLKKILKKDKRFVNKGEVLIDRVIEAASKSDKDLIKLLALDEKMKVVFFANAGEHMTFDKDKFIKLISQDLFLMGRYTLFKEKTCSTRQKEFIDGKQRVVFCNIPQTKGIAIKKYYFKASQKDIVKIKHKIKKINDINLHRWKDYKDIITDSLWIIDKRDNSGVHLGWYWGNFIPQIPRQMMLRYTRKGDWVLDAFLGSGTTLIECRRLGRNGIGIELNPEVAARAKQLIEQEENKDNIITEVVIGDSRTINLKKILNNYEIDKVQLIIMHPPYHDIIKFSNDKRDLSNASSVEEFLEIFGEVVNNIEPYLEKKRYLVLVIGDKYSKGEWIPLGFYCMNEILKRNFLLKSIIVKNFEETRGKRNQKALWRYRALAGGFYVFKHEYIMIFEKK